MNTLQCVQAHIRLPIGRQWRQTDAWTDWRMDKQMDIIDAWSRDLAIVSCQYWLSAKWPKINADYRCKCSCKEACMHTCSSACTEMCSFTHICSFSPRFLIMGLLMQQDWTVSHSHCIGTTLNNWLQLPVKYGAHRWGYWQQHVNNYQYGLFPQCSICHSQ